MASNKSRRVGLLESHIKSKKDVKEYPKGMGELYKMMDDTTTDIHKLYAKK